MRASIFLMLLAGLLFTACKHESIQKEIEYGYEYFPLTAGAWKEYRVDSVIYSPFGVDSNSWIFREVTDSIYDAGDDTREAIINIYIRPYDSVLWNEGYKVISRYRGEDQAEEWTDNTRFIKLVFPIINDKRWDGNAMNIMGAQYYRYKATGYSSVIGGVQYNDLVKVVQQELSTLVSFDYDEETYCKNIGLIEARKEHLSNLLAQTTGYTMYKTLVAISK